jgi:hypothetical protein
MVGKILSIKKAQDSTQLTSLPKQHLVNDLNTL